MEGPGYSGTDKAYFYILLHCDYCIFLYCVFEKISFILELIGGGLRAPIVMLIPTEAYNLCWLAEVTIQET